MPHSGAHGTQRTEIKSIFFQKTYHFLKVVVYS